MRDGISAGALAAHALDRHILNGPQQFRLRGERQIGCLVEKQRAAVGVLELAASAADAGRCAVLDSEELRLEYRLDHSRTADRDAPSISR